MGTWLDLLQVALALGAGWLGYVLVRLSRPTPGRRPYPARDLAVAARRLPVANPQAIDSEL
jgi:hypothetical protein